MPILRVLVVLVGALALTGPAVQAQTATVNQSITPQTMSAILTKAGYPAQIADGSGGGALLGQIVKTTIDGKGVFIYFYDCTVGACASYEFVLSLPPQPNFTEDFANRWNLHQRFVRGMIAANGNFVVQYDAEVSGGVTDAYLANTVALFAQILADYDKFQ